MCFCCKVRLVFIVIIYVMYYYLLCIFDILSCPVFPYLLVVSVFIVFFSLPAFLSNFELVERIKFCLAPFGNIVSVKASRDRKNRPYAFVQFQVTLTLVDNRYFTFTFHLLFRDPLLIFC